MKTFVLILICIGVLSIVVTSCKKPDVTVDELNYNVYDIQYEGPDYITKEDVYYDTLDFGNWIEVYHAINFRVNTAVFENGLVSGTKLRINIVVKSPGYEDGYYSYTQPFSMDDPEVFVHPFIPGTSATISYDTFLVIDEFSLKKHSFQFVYP
jgi:hypothetical protein